MIVCVYHKKGESIMKKKIKIALLAMLLCVGLIFTGCGGQLDSDVNVNIGNEADYVACTENQDIMTVLMQESETPEEETNTQSVKVTLKVKLTVPTGVGTETTTIDIKANVLVEVTLVDDETVFGLACKVTATTEEGTEVYEVYVKDGYLYVSDGEDKVKCLLSDLIDEDDIVSSELIGSLSTIIDELGDVLGDYTKQKVTADGSKYMIDLDGVNLYIILKDNQFAQLYLTVSDLDLGDIIGTIAPDASLAVEGVKVDFSVALELGTTKIDFPSLEEYTEDGLDM